MCGQQFFLVMKTLSKTFIDKQGCI